MSDITKLGISQTALFQFLSNIVTVVNELRTDHATFKTVVDELVTDVGTIATFQAALTAKLDADSGITDTNYAATLTEVVAPTAAALSLTGYTDS
jgi:hypothetical protein